MSFRDGLSAELPSPRDDEPASLRNDIFDELADHLACAYRRELLRGADAATAQQRVLEHFGDPALLARRLWFDAMRGKIMTQRILVVCCIVLTMVSLSLAFLMWNQAMQSRRMALAELEHARHEAELARKQMLEQLQSLSKSASASKSPVWIPVSFRLTRNTPDGPPAVGVQALLGRGSHGADKEDAILRESDDKGMIDFGVIQPGDWSFNLRRPMKDGAWIANGYLSALPGTSIEKAIVSPAKDEPTAPVVLRIDWPPDLADQGLSVVASLKHEGFTYQPPLHWIELHDFDSELSAGTRHVLCGPKAGTARRLQRGSPGFWSYASRAESTYGPPGMSPGTAPVVSLPKGVAPSPEPKEYKLGQVYVDASLIDRSGEPGAIPMLHGRYELRRLIIVRAGKELSPGNNAKRFELVDLFSLNQAAYEQVPDYPDPPPGAVNSIGLAGSFILRQLQVITATALPQRFEARKDVDNTWTIHLPDELTTAVRRKLKDETKP